MGEFGLRADLLAAACHDCGGVRSAIPGFARKFEPLLLVCIAFGCLLVNLMPDLMAEPVYSVEDPNKLDAVGGMIYYLYQGVKLGIYPSLIFMVTGGKVNPLIGSAGVSAVPMAARVSQIEGQRANPENFLLMHAMDPNVAGVIGSAVAAGVFLAVFK